MVVWLPGFHVHIPLLGRPLSSRAWLCGPSAPCAMSPLLRCRRAGFLTATADAELELLDAVPDDEASTLPRRWVLFTDLHVQKDTLPTCVRVLRRVAAEAQSRDAGIIWAGTDDGLIHLTRDGGRNWTNVTPPPLRARP